ncbi:MAG: HD domain-containing protein [Clostridiaceae bacterium]|nr:HD domain-containing protein [Clostridiaceae bacterium]
MIRKSLIMKIFSAAYMQRWNDKLRPIELIELDKQAHKMFIAYFLGKYEETKPGFSWIEIIEGGIFEMLQRIVITDIKPPVFYKIKEDPRKYKLLNEYVYDTLETIISPLGEDFCDRFRNYFADDEPSINKKILNAAHNYASRWEFEIIERLNPNGYEIQEIKREFIDRIEKFNDLEGMKQLALNNNYKNFIELCGHLRFQARWSHLHRIPKTSVLGHSLFVAILSYLFSLEIKACPVRCSNNFFQGLFHDLPEVLTRDIISPIKTGVKGLSDLIKEIENEQMEKQLYPLVPKEFLPEIRMFIETEFENVVLIDGRVENKSCEEINEKYNEDKYSPRDGNIIKASDELAAFIEAKAAIENGAVSEEFQEAKLNIRARYNGRHIAGINFGEIFADF